MRLPVLLSWHIVMVFTVAATSVCAQQPQPMQQTQSILDEPAPQPAQHFPTTSTPFASGPVQASAACTCSECMQLATNQYRNHGTHAWTHRAARNRHVTYAVAEVQYGANLATPSYGHVTHGPWYNGDVFGTLGLLHRRIRGGHVGRATQSTYSPYAQEHYPTGPTFYQLEPSHATSSNYPHFQHSQSFTPTFGTTDTYRPMGR